MKADLQDSHLLMKCFVISLIIFFNWSESVGRGNRVILYFYPKGLSCDALEHSHTYHGDSPKEGDQFCIRPLNLKERLLFSEDSWKVQKVTRIVNFMKTEQTREEHMQELRTSLDYGRISSITLEVSLVPTSYYADK